MSKVLTCEISQHKLEEYTEKLNNGGILSISDETITFILWAQKSQGSIIDTYPQILSCILIAKI